MNPRARAPSTTRRRQRRDAPRPVIAQAFNAEPSAPAAEHPSVAFGPDTTFSELRVRDLITLLNGDQLDRLMLGITGLEHELAALKKTLFGRGPEAR